ncbi:MAG: DUF5610 domain-containing protein [Gammaproteobacteria bacterium SHHR-1]|uniref:DUF5610 domain-containing protein n=1 Tax=Magnetovirga frankeli TaxID=947516 RepID=UPI0012935F51|nr:DUF5610 domain-containing protein [gamma proteobacterium SS-5]
MANSIQSIGLPPQTQAQNSAQAGALKERGAAASRAETGALGAVADDSLELRKPSAQQLLNDQIMQAIGGLNDYLKAEGFETIERLDPADYTPDKVSDRILNFIDLSIKQAEAKGADADELERMREQARAGVEAGYKKAYDMLEGLGMMQGKVKEDVEKTYELLQQGLDRMDRGEPLLAGEAEKANTGLEVNAQAESRSLTLEIQTAEGDKISIDLQRSSSNASLAYQAEDDNGRFSLNMQQRQSEFSFQYRVEGNLNQEEERAIKDLLKDVDKLADDFFAGNTPDLLKTGLKNGFDSDQLGSFNLQMNHSQSRLAASAYQQVDQLEGRPRDRAPGTPPGQLLQQLRDSGERAGLALGERFGNPSDMLKELLVQRLELEPRFDSTFGKDSGDEAPETPQSLTDKMLQTVSE